MAADRPTVHPLIGDRRPELELEWLRLVREIAEITGQGPEEIPPLWDGRRKLDPAKLSPDRLLHDVTDLRARRAAIEKPVALQLAAQPGPDEWTQRASELAGEFVRWREGQDQSEHRATALGRWFDLKGIPREPFPTTAWVAVSDRLKERDRKAAS